jgi:hypothetical protein
MKEILVYGNPISQFKRLQINPKRTYKSKDKEYSVYEVTKSEFKILDKDTDTDDLWSKNDCAWIVAKGSNLGSVDKRYNVNGHYLIAWNDDKNSGRTKWYSYSPLKYKNIFEYLEYRVGATSWRNVASCLYCLAEQNSLTLSELMVRHAP